MSMQENNVLSAGSALAIGNFDGVHIGHHALISAASQWASQNNAKTVVLTFHPHPAAVVAPHRVPLLICTLEQRIRLLKSAGAAEVVVLPFTEKTARLSPQEFVEEVVVNTLETKAVFVGESFRFGHKQAGTPETLLTLAKQYGFAARFLPPVKFRDEIVSSSLIRKYLSEGRLGRAGRLLGRCFSLEGRVVSGRGIGRKETVPTLNLHPAPGQIVPRGIYISETIEQATGRHWPSVTSAGTNPTFDGKELTIETYLLEPLEGASPKAIEVRFRRFIRPERKFPNAEALRAEIVRDVERAQTYWRRVMRFSSLLERTPVKRKQ